MTNQRGVTAILMFVLLIIGAILGHPGAFPVINGDTLTPEILYQLIMSVFVPVGALFLLFKGVLAAINGRVTSEAVNPGDLTALLTLPEFWLGLLGTVVFVLQVFLHVTLLDENTQAIVANAIIALIAGLTKSWGDRSPGSNIILVNQAVTRQIVGKKAA